MHRFELGKRKASPSVPRPCVRAATSNRRNLPRIASFRAQPAARTHGAPHPPPADTWGAAARPADARNNVAERPAWGAAAERNPPHGRTGAAVRHADARGAASPSTCAPPHPAPAHLRAGSLCRAFSTCFAAAANDRVKMTSCCCAAALLAQTAHAGARIIRGARRPSGRRGIMRHAAPRTKEAPCQREPTRSPLRSTT